MFKSSIRCLIVAAALGALSPATWAQGRIPRAEPVNPQGVAASANVGLPAAERTSSLIDPDRKIQPGDQIAVVIEEDNESAPMLRAVGAAGNLDMTPLGSVKVAGMTSGQAAAAIKRFLEGDYYYKATVRLSVERVNVEASRGTIYLSGEVNAVGPQAIYAGRQLLLSQAILNAGGFRKFADSRKVKVTRSNGGTPQTFSVDVKQVIEKGRSDLDMELEDGDRVFVPEAFFKY